MKYDIKKPAPDWAIREAFKRHSPNRTFPDYWLWNTWTLGTRHMAHLVALTEEAPIDPLVLKARRLYCAVNDIDEEYIEAPAGWLAKSGGWEGRIRREAVARVVEILNAEA